jgi:hypothetical protein
MVLESVLHCYAFCTCLVKGFNYVASILRVATSTFSFESVVLDVSVEGMMRFVGGVIVGV